MTQRNATGLDETSTRIPFQTRKLCLRDIPSLPPIFNHFITSSVISFRLSPVDVHFFQGVFNTTYAHDLPFLVATTSAPPSIAAENADSVERVIGYAYAIPWRPNYPAYRHTVELSIYVHPEYQSVGAGSALMDALMIALRTTRVRDPTTASASTPDTNDSTIERPDGPEKIRQVLAIASLDTEGRDGGYGLKKFYSRWGFEQIGQMKKVGFKFGRWIDVMILQASL